MASKMPADYRPLTPPLTWPERIADVLVVSVLIFWFAFLGLTPKKVKRLPHEDERPAGDPAERPYSGANEPRQDPVPGIAAE